MGIYREETMNIKMEKTETLQRKKKACMDCLWSFMVSLTGGLLLGLWSFEYHPANSQLWMVPLGLILFITPLIVWVSVFISDFCNDSTDENLGVLHPVKDSVIHVHDIER